MNSTTSNDMPDAASPETPIPEPRPVPRDTDTSDRVREMHAGAEQGWTDHGGMVEQQASAIEWVRASDQQRAEFSPVINQPETPREAAQTYEAHAAASDGGEHAAAETTDSRQAQYSRWTGEPLGETAEITQSAGIGQSH